MSNANLIKLQIICLIGVIFSFVFLFFFSFFKKPIVEIQKETVFVERNISPIPCKDLGEYTLTFYTHTGNRTKTGVHPKARRTIAVDPKVIPLNSYVYIEGWGIYHAEDTGGKVRGNRIDIFLDSKEDCIKNGIKKAKVYKIGD